MKVGERSNSRAECHDLVDVKRTGTGPGVAWGYSCISRLRGALVLGRRWPSGCPNAVTEQDACDSLQQTDFSFNKSGFPGFLRLFSPT